MHDDRQGVRGAGGGRWRGWAAIGLLALLFLGSWVATRATDAEIPVLLLAAAGLLILGYLGAAALEPMRRTAEDAEARARGAEEHLESLFGTCGEGVLVLDEEGVLQGANPAAERLFGYPQHELRGSRVQMLLADLEVRDGSPGLTREMAGRRRDDVEVPLEIELSPRNADGRRYLVVRDAGRLRAAEALARAAEDERRRVAAAAIEAIFVFDREGRIQEANPAAERLVGKAWSQLAGRELADMLLHRDHRAAFRRDLREAASGGPDRVAGRSQVVELWITGRPAIRARIQFARAGGRWFAFVLPEAEAALPAEAPTEAEAEREPPATGDGRAAAGDGAGPAADAARPLKRIVDERRDGRQVG